MKRQRDVMKNGFVLACADVDAEYYIESGTRKPSCRIGEGTLVDGVSLVQLVKKTDGHYDVSVRGSGQKVVMKEVLSVRAENVKTKDKPPHCFRCMSLVSNSGSVRIWKNGDFEVTMDPKEKTRHGI